MRSSLVDETLKETDPETVSLEVGLPADAELPPRRSGVLGALLEHLPRRWPSAELAREFCLGTLFVVFFLFYGLTPFLGGAGLGLVGADEPRYAQIAHEMLEKLNLAHNFKEQLSACITPYLYGVPWLEKPALYYWRAMLFYKEFGVHDWSARLPSGSFAITLVGLIYLHMRRFRKGGHLDAALITAACVGIVGFARGASTDMQMAAPLAIGLLGWYAWYETGSKFWLFDLYFFTATATLAKGPVAPFLALVIVFAFAALRNEWGMVKRSFWWPGMALYFAIVLPWFIAVQHKNPTFFREFFLEHNLERYATDKYQHSQPFWYYGVVLLLALMPWTVVSLRALVDGARKSVTEWRLRHAGPEEAKKSKPGDAFPEFLVLWALIPIVFFSFSGSKLPGYILPSLPPITILTGDWLYRARKGGLGRWTLGGHAFLTGLMTLVALLLPWLVSNPDKLPPVGVLCWVSAVGAAAALLTWAVVARFGVRRLRPATSLVLMGLLLYLFGIGPIFGVGEVEASKATIRMLDRNYSARPLAEKLAAMTAPGGVAAGDPVAVFRVRRDMEYGLAFYRNHQVANYEDTGVPAGEHLLVVRVAGRHGVDLGSQAALREYLADRQYRLLFPWPEQALEIYRVGPRTTGTRTTGTSSGN